MSEKRPEYATMPNRDPLADLIPRIVENPEFVAWALAKYRRIEGISEEELRMRLELDERAYTRLSLCEMPVQDPEHFAVHLEQIATYTGVDIGAFASLLREVAAIETLPPRTIEGASTTSVANPKPVARRPFFMAARDRSAESTTLSEHKLHYKTEAQYLKKSTHAADDQADDQATDEPHTSRSEKSATTSPAPSEPDRTSDQPQANPSASKDSSDDNPANQADNSDPAART